MERKRCLLHYFMALSKLFFFWQSFWLNFSAAKEVDVYVCVCVCVCACIFFTNNFQLTPLWYFFGIFVVLLSLFVFFISVLYVERIKTLC